MTTERMFRTLFALTLASALALQAGCRKRDDAPPPEPPTPTSHITAPVRETPEQAAATLRWLSEQRTDASDLVASFDPSQANTIGRVLAPTLIFMAQTAELRRTAVRHLGEEAGRAVDEASTIYAIEFGNGLAEMFEADAFDDVRRFGSLAFVMAMREGQPIGAPIVFRENQGEWLLLLTDGDDPWPQDRIANYVALLTGPVSSAPVYAQRFAQVGSRVRSGDIRSVESLRAALEDALR